MPWNPTEPYNDLPDLPPKAEVETKKILKRSIEAREALAALDAAVQRLPNPDVLIAPITLQEARDSSAIENIVTTDDALFKQSELGGEPTEPSVKEALRYRAALYDAYNKLPVRPLGPNSAIDICQRLTGVAAGIRAVPGTTLRNNAGDVVYTPPNGKDLILDKLSNWANFIQENKEIDALVRIAIQHYQFEAIHPFPDGNGRTGRILNILLLVEQKLLAFPILYLSREILASRDWYYKSLSAVTAQGSWEGWIEYFLMQLTRSAQKTAIKALGIQFLLIDTKSYIKSKAPKTYTHELIDFLFSRTYCRIEDMTSKGIAKRQTASSYLRNLARLGVLQETKVGREKLFVHSKFLELLTTDGSKITKYKLGAAQPDELLLPFVLSPPTAQTF